MTFTNSVCILDRRGWGIPQNKKTKTENFYVDNKRLSNSSFQNLVDGYPIPVEVSTLDNQHRSANNICFIKIDTEGTELDVLNGAKYVIENLKGLVLIL